MHAGLLADNLRRISALLLLPLRIDHHISADALTDFGCPCTLPDNRMCKRFSGAPSPCSGGLPLVADSEAGDLLFVDPGLLYKIFYNLYGVFINFGEVMGDPSFFIYNLTMWQICSAYQ